MTGLPDHFQRFEQRRNSILSKFVNEGFLFSYAEITYREIASGVLVSDHLPALGSIQIDIFELLRKLGGDADDPLIDRVKYSYNVSVAGRGNVFRYNSPHADHPEGDPRREHHVHRFDPFAPEPADTETVDVISEDDGRPGLEDVLREAADWYYDHAEALER